MLIAPNPAQAGDASKPAAAPPQVYSWDDPHAKVLPTGALEWAPKPFVFEKGDSVRYIDFETGSDANDGKSRMTPWKHHPWDANATGAAKECEGIQTYVFKGGVVYRGALTAAESGAPGNPIRLTRDPAWGNGYALFYGSTRIEGGWKKATAAEAPGIPRPEQVWYIDLGKNFAPVPGSAKFSALWQIDGGKVERLHIARKPSYDLSDPDNPVKNWPTWSAYDKKSGVFTSPFLKNLGDKNLLNGAILWTEGGFLMGSATKVDLTPGCYDPAAGSVTLEGKAGDDDFARIPGAKVHFMIENVPQFLDTPGEYFYAADGPKAGRLYIDPPAGVDPNRVAYEAASICFPISLTDRHDIDISGLEFRYNNPDDGGFRDFFVTEGSPSPCVRILGNSANITVKNCRFYYVADAVLARSHANGKGETANEVIDNIVISDNDVQHAERGGAITVLGGGESNKGSTYCQLKHVEVLRNRLIDTGFRHGYSPWSSIPAIYVSWPETCEVAGNIVDTTLGNGIITYGGKPSGCYNNAPLTRILVHHNQIDNSMLGCNDYGGLEHFQGGPVYIYDNVVRNCVGNRTLGGELGYSIYLDGGFKCYTFNNIMAGKVKPGRPDYYNNCGYFMVFGFMDQLFNNTIFHFDNDLDGSSGNRSNILGNLIIDGKSAFIRQNRPGDVSMMGGGDTGEMGRMGIPTMSYASNVFYGSPKTFGVISGIGTQGMDSSAKSSAGDTLDELRKNLENAKCRLGSVGWQVSTPPLVAPEKNDFHPTLDSGVAGRGVKYFVPWALARNVGEWNFYKSESNPQIVLGEGFYMTGEYLDRGMYYFLPRNDLTVSNCSAKDYVPGPLEDWTDGALSFDGKDRIATLSHAEMTKSMSYPAIGDSPASTYDGSKRETLDMAANNFLIEIVFKTDLGRANGTLVSKSAESGYDLTVAPTGGVCMTIHSGTAGASAVSTIKVNDGKWHHVIAEVDRAVGKITIYIDGKAAGETTLGHLIAADAPLSNTADFTVGKGFAGAMDFLRVCRSTLSESRTNIEELYAWEFNGPFLRDFTGKSPANGKRDAGAIGRE